MRQSYKDVQNVIGKWTWTRGRCKKNVAATGWFGKICIIFRLLHEGLNVVPDLLTSIHMG